MTTDLQKPIDPFMISRDYTVPVAKLYRMWSEPDAMRQWWGPKGASVTAADLDLRSGGSYHYGMKTPDGTEMWGIWRILEVEPQHKLVFISAFSNAERGLTRHPMNADWPLELTTEIRFEPIAGGARVTVIWTPHNASDVELATFEAGRTSMKMGWGGSLDVLESVLKET